MADILDYINLITSEHREKPNFVATVTIDVTVSVRVQNLLLSMIALFDLDTAVGDQLDIIGQWVGVSRDVNIPVEGIYFTWDGTDYTLGWDFGVWEPENQPYTVTSLPDDVYRTLIRATIAANHWDGTTEGAYTIWSEIFPELTILIQDNQDMTMDIIFVGAIVDSLTLALITSGAISLKPEGVHINNFYVPVNTGPVFGWDIENSYVQGWDEGSWTRELDPT